MEKIETGLDQVMKEYDEEEMEELPMGEDQIDAQTMEEMIAEFMRENKETITKDLFRKYQEEIPEEEVGKMTAEEKEEKGILLGQDEIKRNKVGERDGLILMPQEVVQKAEREIKQVKHRKAGEELHGKIIKLAEKYCEESDSQESEEEEEEPKEMWDCESIISTYTNTDNHPALISEVRVRKQI